MFKILNPCRKKSWAEIPGDKRKRFCDQCGHHVHAIHRYSEADRTGLLNRPGRLCIYDGDTVPPSTSRRWLLGVTLLGTLRPLWASTATIRLKVTDATGAPITGAVIRAQRTNQRLLAEATTGPQGDGSLTGLPEDDELEITAHAQGFLTWRQQIRPVTSGGKVIEATLQVAAPSMGIFLDTRPPRKPWWRRLWR